MSIFSWLFGQRKKKSEQTVNLTGPGTFSAQVVGESFYQGKLERISGGYSENGVEEIVTAELIHDDNNPYDNKAIRVEISGTTVGHLSRAVARYFRKKMIANGYGGLIAICKAKITGGWDRGHKDTGRFGVVLDLPHNFIEDFEEAVSANRPKDNGNRPESFSFYVDKTKSEELVECQVGDYVNFWSPNNEPDKVHIFRRGSVGGTGRIGFVPSKYSYIISSHIGKRLEYETEITDLASKRCKIKCRLISKEETEAKKNKEKENLRRDLTKKYSPKKPITFFINADSIKKIKVGDKLQIKFESFDYYIDQPYEWRIKLLDSMGNVVGIKKDEKSTILKRILKAHFNSYLFQVDVISTTEKHECYDSPVKVTVKPYKN